MLADRIKDSLGQKVGIGKFDCSVKNDLCRGMNNNGNILESYPIMINDI